MGVEASKNGGSTESNKRLPTGIPRVARHKLIARWRKRQLPVQLFAVARHVERADSAFAVVNGGARWTRTADFRQWPLDPPISDGGMEEAKVLGRKVRELAESTGSPIHVVICSPYYRCVQTAVEICRELGSKVRMLIDREIGEVYGPAIMGHEQPTFPVRPIEHTHDYCSCRDVVCHPELIGKWPTWPEDLKSARHRYANRFLTHLQRSTTTRRNFILVTHADCVGAALTMMPSQADHAVQSVEYGGCFVAKRIRHDYKPAERVRRKSLPTHFARICPVSDEAENASGVLADAEGPLDWETQSDANEGRMQEDAVAAGLNRRDSVAAWDDMLSVELPHASDGWQVHTSEINLCSTVQNKVPNSKSSSRFTKRVKTLAKNSCFSREEITKLLGALSDQPLGEESFLERTLSGVEDDCEQRATSTSVRSPQSQTVTSFPTSVSLSTYLFGSSDVGDTNDSFSDQSLHSPRSSIDDPTKEGRSTLEVSLTVPFATPKIKLISAENSSDSAVTCETDDGNAKILTPQRITKRQRDGLKVVKSTKLVDPQSARHDCRLISPRRLSSLAEWHDHNTRLSLHRASNVGDFASLMFQRQVSSQSSLESKGTFSSSDRESNNADLSDRSSAVSSDCSNASSKRNPEVTYSRESNNNLCRVPRSFMRSTTGFKYRKKSLALAHDLSKDGGGGGGGSVGGSGGDEVNGCATCQSARTTCQSLNSVLMDRLVDSAAERKPARSVTIINSAKPVGDERKVVPLKGFDGSTLLQRRFRNQALHTSASVVGLPSDNGAKHVSPKSKLNSEQIDVSNSGNGSMSSSSCHFNQSQKQGQHLASIKNRGPLRMPPRSPKCNVSSWKVEKTSIQAHDIAGATAFVVAAGVDDDCIPRPHADELNPVNSFAVVGSSDAHCPHQLRAQGAVASMHHNRRGCT